MYVWLRMGVNVAELLLFLTGIYYFVISLFSLGTYRRRYVSNKINRFAIVIPAHNEQSVIAGLLKSLRQLEYPQDHYRVFVLADNCTDATPYIAAACGVRVIERQDRKRSGKGHALNYAFSYLLGLDEKFDYISVVDADNLAGPRFLTELNDCANMGYQAVQGYIDSKNARSSWLAHAYSVWYWITNRVSSLGRFNLGLGVRLGGTGFAVECDLLKTMNFDTDCLAEDADMSLHLAVEGIKVGWAHKAVVYDEKPTNFRQSLLQRVRWMQGIADAQGRYLGKLLHRGRFHAVMTLFDDMLGPVCYAFFLLVYVLATMSLLGLHETRLADMWTMPLNYVLLNLYIWGSIAVTLAGLLKDKKLNSRVVLNLFGFLLYIVSWIPAGVVGILKHSRKEWYHTEHDSSGVV